MSTDGYILAIPLSELQDAAIEATPECGCQNDAVRQQCAETLVEARICPCLLGAPCIIGAVAADFCKWMDLWPEAAPFQDGMSGPCRHTPRLEVA